MKITLQMSIIMSAIFALICFSAAIYAFSGLSDIADPVQRADGTGFAWFWAFLGGIALAFGALAAWLMKTGRGDEEA